MSGALRSTASASVCLGGACGRCPREAVSSYLLSRLSVSLDEKTLSTNSIFAAEVDMREHSHHAIHSSALPTRCSGALPTTARESSPPRRRLSPWVKLFEKRNSSTAAANSPRTVDFTTLTTSPHSIFSSLTLVPSISTHRRTLCGKEINMHRERFFRLSSTYIRCASSTKSTDAAESREH